MEEKETLFISFNGHRSYIEQNKHILEKLKSEGWTIGEPRITLYNDDSSPSSLDKINYMIWREF